MPKKKHGKVFGFDIFFLCLLLVVGVEFWVSGIGDESSTTKQHHSPEFEILKGNEN